MADAIAVDPSQVQSITVDPSMVSAVSTETPGIMSRIGSQIVSHIPTGVQDFFSTAAHTMNPENLMAQVPTSWQDLKDKWQAENEDLAAHGQGAVNQFKQGNIGTGVSTLMNAEPFIGQPTGQAAEYLRQGNVGKAAGTLAPYLAPAIPEAVSGAASGIKNATSRGLDWAADATAPLQGKAANAVNALPPTLVRNGLAAMISGVSPHPLIGWFTGKAMGQMVVDWAKKNPGVSLKDAPPEIQAAAMEQNPGVSIGQTGTTSGLPQAYVVPGKKSPGVSIADLPEPQPYPVVGRSATMQGSAMGTTPPPAPIPRVKPGMSPSQGGVGIPRGDVFTGTTGTSDTGGFSGTIGSPSSVPPNPIGPSPQLLKDINKAVGGRPEAAQRWLDDMISRGENDPYTGAALGTRPTTTQPPPTQPAHQSAPATVIPQTPASAVRPPDGPVISDTWEDKSGNKYPVNMISPDQLQAHAQKYGQPISQSRAEIEGQGITIPDTKTIRNSLVYRANKMGVTGDDLKKIAQDQYQREGIGDMTSTELMDAYGNMLKREGPFSEQHHADVLYNKQNKAQILPMQPASGTNMTNVTPFGWPQP